MSAVSTALTHEFLAEFESEPVTATTTRARTALELSVARTAADMDGLEADWNALFQRAGRGQHAFQQFAWLKHWRDHYFDSDREQLFIVTAHRAGRLVFVWPLVRSQMHAVQHLTWMGAPVSQYGDVLIDPTQDTQDIMHAAWDFVRASSNSDIVHLAKTREDADVMPLLSGLKPIVTCTLQAPYIDLSKYANFEAYEQRFSPGWRRNRRRQRRRLDERGAVRLSVAAGSAEARDLATLAIDVKKSWLNARGLMSAAFADRRLARFFGSVAEADVHTTGCFIASLTLQDRPAALDISLVCKDRMLMHVLAYDMEFEKASPGSVLTAETLKRAFEAGLTTFDFLAPSDAYKLEYADGATAVHDFALPLNALGWIYARGYLGGARQLAKRSVKALPLDMRQKLVKVFDRAQARA